MDPVFIVGEQRSGTSLLYHVLQRHPSFRPRRLSLEETHIFSYAPRGFLFRPRYPLSMWRFMLEDDEAYGTFLATIRTVRIPLACFSIPSHLSPQSAGWAYRRSRAQDVVQSYFYFAARTREARRLVEKTPSNVPHIPKLISAFPRCRLLYIHRHPLDVLSSYRRRYRDDRTAGWADVDRLSFCRRYEMSTNAVLDLAERDPSRLLLVRYESFTREPEAQLDRICAFLDEPFAPVALAQEATDRIEWAPDPLLFGPVVQRSTRWSAFVTPHEASEVEDRLDAVMRRLSYDHYTTQAHRR